MTLIERIRKWLSSWWHNEAASVAASLPLPPLGHNRPPRAKEQGDYMVFAHYRFEHLLEDLDDYFEVLRYMRKSDAATYALYRQVGAQVPPERMGIAVGELPASWRIPGAKRPAMGMVHYPRRYTTEEEKEKHIIGTSFVAYHKVKRMQLYFKRTTGSDLYEVALYYHPPKTDHLAGGTFVMELDEAGDLHLLKTPHVSIVQLPARKRGAFRSIGKYPVHKWDYGFLQGALEDHLKLYPDRVGRWKDTEDFAKDIFISTVNTYQDSTSGFQVRVKKDGLTAKFNIQLLRTPYFFKDRQKTVTESGKTKPILHIVRAHRRITAGGVETYVKSHFRGVRKFKWLGYDVIVSMPGLHHAMLEELNMNAYERDDPQSPPEKEMMGAGKFGRFIGEHLDN